MKLLLVNTRLVDRIICLASGEPPESELSKASPELVMAAMAKPETMDKSVFLVLQRMMEQKEDAAARGRDEVAGFRDDWDAIELLLTASPWTMHPDFGCCLANMVEKLDATATSNELLRRVLSNADYGRRPEGMLEEDEIAAMTDMVDEAMKTTNGDAGSVTISTRQLALLLRDAVLGRAK